VSEATIKRPVNPARPKQVFGYLLLTAWFSLVIYLTLPSFLWQVEYYRSPGPAYYKAFLIAAPLVAILSVLYARVRVFGAWQWEPLAMAALPLLSAFWYETSAALWGTLVVISSYIAGRILLDRLGLKVGNPVGEWALCIGSGFGLFTLMLFALGMMGLYREWVFVGLCGAPLAIFFRSLRGVPRGVKRIHQEWQTQPCLRSPLVGVSVFFAAIFLACALAVVLAPTISYDALNFHLSLAEWYVGEGSLQASYFHCYSYFPQTFETLSAWLYGLGGLPAAQLLGPMFFALSLAMCIHIGCQCRWSAEAVVIGVIVAAAIPFVHRTGSVVKNDLAMAFFQLAALSCYLSWRRDGNFRWIYLGAFLLATSFGVKHSAIFGALPLLLLGAQAASRQSRPVRALGYICLILLVSGAFWHTRTFVLTGNPTYPEGLERAIDVFNADDPNTAMHNLTRYLKIPWRALFGGGKLFEHIIPVPMGIYFALFTPLALWPWVRPAHRERWVAGFFVLVATFYWMSEMSTLRYGIAPLILCPLLISPRLVELWHGAKTPLRAFVLLLLVYSFVFSWSATMIIENDGPQLRYLAGEIDKRTYLKAVLPPYAAVEAVGDVAGPGDEVLAVDGCAAIYFPESWRFHCRRLRRGKNVGLQVDGWLAERSYLFIIVPSRLDVTGELATFQAVELYRDSHYTAYRLEPPSVSAATGPDEDLHALVSDLRGRSGKAPSACVF